MARTIAASAALALALAASAHAQVSVPLPPIPLNVPATPAPTPAPAPQFGPSQIVVNAPAGRVLIDRAPFRMTFEDRSGRTVLQEVPNPGAPGPNAVGEQPLSTGRVQDTGFYAPLALELGGAASTQYPGSSYGGNLLLAGRAGIFLVPTSVTRAVAFGGGVELTVATTDPLHSIDVRITPDAGRGVRVQAAPTDATGVVAMSDSFVARPGEAFRGFGGRHDSLDQRGRSFYDWTEQENIPPGRLQPLADFASTDPQHYLFPNGPTAAYYVQNQFVSSAGYGFLLNRTELSRWRLANDRPDAWQFAVDAPAVDYTVAIGDARSAIRTLTGIGGRQPVPPRWAQGAMLLRGVQVLSAGSDNVDTYRAKVEADLKQIEQLRPPITAYAYEGWNGLGDAFVRATNAKLIALGIRPMGYVRAFVSGDGLFDTQQEFTDAISGGYVATTPGGLPYLFPVVYPAGQIDFTNPAAVRWWDGRLKRMLDLGFDGFMQDFGEATVEDMHFHDGETGHTMHNRYPLLYHAVTRRFVDSYERSHPKRPKIFFYTRSGFSGRPGSAASEGGNFAGDGTSDWTVSGGLPSQTPDMLNRAIGGAPGFTTDIGGYLDNDTSDGQPLSAELFVRWSQWSALTPFFRLHNSCCTVGTRMPWSFDAATYARWRSMALLHARAASYIRRLWQETERDGMPPTRPLWLAAPGDPAAAGQDQEWMLGPDVLVAPVVQQGATSRTVYFPSGCWQDANSGVRHAGAGSATVAAPLDALPYFFRCGRRPFAAR